MKKLATVFVFLAVIIALAPSAEAGGAACKIIIDEKWLASQSAALIVTLDGVGLAYPDLDEYLTADERAKALKLSDEMCDFAEKIEAFNAKVGYFYRELATKHRYDATKKYSNGGAGGTALRPE